MLALGILMPMFMKDLALHSFSLLTYYVYRPAVYRALKVQIKIILYKQKKGVGKMWKKNPFCTITR